MYEALKQTQNKLFCFCFGFVLDLFWICFGIVLRCFVSVVRAALVIRAKRTDHQRHN